MPPEASGGIPTGVAIVPETSGGIPTGVAIVPETSGGIPTGVAVVSEASGGIPTGVAVVSEASGAFLQITIADSPRKRTIPWRDTFPLCPEATPRSFFPHSPEA